MSKIISKKYCVYEHWVNGKCIYVGSGDYNRPFEFDRSSKWLEIFPTKEEWDKVKYNVVKIVHETDSRDDAYTYEENQTIKRFNEGYDLLNIRIGRKFKDPKDSPLYGMDLKGENNPFYGKKHTQEAKEKIGQKAKERFTKGEHPALGKRGNTAVYTRLLYKNNVVKDFDSLKDCMEWCKENLEGFPIKALKSMFKTGLEYKAFHSKYKKFDGYRLEKSKNKEDFL